MNRSDTRTPFEINAVSVPSEALFDLLALADPDRSAVQQYAREGTCYQVREDGGTVAAAVLRAENSNVIELMNIAVAERHQRRGIGAALLRFLIEEVRTAGYKRLTVGTGNSSLGPLALYQKAGFRIAGVIPNHFIDHYDEPIVENGIPCRDMIRLYLDLSPSTDGNHTP